MIQRVALLAVLVLAAGQARAEGEDVAFGVDLIRPNPRQAIVTFTAPQAAGGYLLEPGVEEVIIRSEGWTCISNIHQFYNGAGTYMTLGERLAQDMANLFDGISEIAQYRSSTVDSVYRGMLAQHAGLPADEFFRRYYNGNFPSTWCGRVTGSTSIAQNWRFTTIDETVRVESDSLLQNVARQGGEVYSYPSGDDKNRCYSIDRLEQMKQSVLAAARLLEDAYASHCPR